VRVGVDVGGTNTDAVAMEGRTVRGSVKSPTTVDVTSGIVASIRSLIDDGTLVPSEVTSVMIGTTHFTNAVVEAKRLVPTAAVRLGLPATASLPPLVDWPDRLRDTIGNHVYLCHGGHEFDGRQISPLDHDELRRVAIDAAEKGIRAMAVTSVFSPVTSEFEREASEVIRSEIPEMVISLSHEMGRIGLLERENATVMNACLRPLAEQTVEAFSAAIDALKIEAPLFISQNDGTLMSAEHTRQFPVATFASGPTNSMRGAAFLSDVRDGAVIDVGGTTADVGLLVNGFPREASTAVDIGGVRTNFRMPDVISFGIGGGSLVRTVPGGVSVGPDSVGRELRQRALVFGGDVLTATDITVAAGLAEIGDPALVAHLEPALIRSVRRHIQRTVAEAVERMKTSPGPIPIVVVGGGGVLLDDHLEGASVTVRPDHFDVANAIGAAIAQVGGEVDRIYALDGLTREEVVYQAKDEARQRAIGAGAQPTSVEIVDVEQIPLAYLPGSAIRIRVKAVGDLKE